MPTLDDMLESWWTQLQRLPKASQDKAIAAALKERAEDLCWNIAAHHAIGVPGLIVKLRLIHRDVQAGGPRREWAETNIRTALESAQRLDTLMAASTGEACRAV